MSLSYALVRVLTDGGDPNINSLKNLDPLKAIGYLMKPGNMKGKFLGACLDSCRWGGPVSVMWPTNVRGLMGLIQKWREENDDNPNLYHERQIDELYKRFELPHVVHDSCPRDKTHKRTFVDSGGVVRCGERGVVYARPSFIVQYGLHFDERSQMHISHLFEDEPMDPSYVDDGGELVVSEDYEDYLKRKELFDKEEPSTEIVDVCYSILDDRTRVLSFENILRRQNLSPENSHEVVFPFDGWDLAYFVQRWKEQTTGGDPPWFADRYERWFFTNTERYGLD